MLDPRIMKFGNISHAEVQLDERYRNKKYYQMPNMFFFLLEENVPWDEYLAPRRGIPWYHNTLFISIYLLYHLGVRRIVLAGSDFAVGEGGNMYAHKTNLDTLQQKWNTDLYNSQVHELRRLKPIFDRAKLEFCDCSVKSRIAQVYSHITLERAVELCLQAFPPLPVDPASLPHCSRFASKSIQERIANWPGYQVIGNARPQPEKAADKRAQVM